MLRRYRYRDRSLRSVVWGDGLRGMGFTTVDGDVADFNTVPIPIVITDNPGPVNSVPAITVSAGPAQTTVPGPAPSPVPINFLGPPAPAPAPFNFHEPPIQNPDTHPDAWPGLTTIPANGPLPPGAGYQQVEAPGNPYPYVYIGPGGNPAAASTCTVTPRYLPDPTQQFWDYNNHQQANWIFQGWPDANSVYDIYMRQDGLAWAAVAPGGGFMYNDPRRPTVMAYSSCAPAALPASPASAPATASSSGSGQQQWMNLLHGSGSSSMSMSFSQFWNKYKGWIVAGGIGLVVVPPLLKKMGR